MIGEILSVVAPIFVLTALGFGWVKRDLPFDNNTISNLVMYLATPSLVFASLTELKVTTATLVQLGTASASVIGFCLVVGYLFLRVLKWDRHAFLPALIQPNAGNMGLPLVLLTFGEAGLALGVIVFFVHAVSQYSLGVAISSGRFDPSWLAKQPIIWAVAASSAVLGFDLTVPEWLRNTTELLGGLLIPGMLLMLGASLARMGVVNPGKIVTLALARFGLGCSAAFCAIWAFDLQGTSAGVLFLQACMPVAVFNFVFAERFDRNPDQVAALVLVSTLLSLLTLPLLVAYAINMGT